jgi:hypothetical protein
VDGMMLFFFLCAHARTMCHCIKKKNRICYIQPCGLLDYMRLFY